MIATSQQCWSYTVCGCVGTGKKLYDSVSRRNGRSSPSVVALSLAELFGHQCGISAVLRYPYLRSQLGSYLLGAFSLDVSRAWSVFAYNRLLWGVTWCKRLFCWFFLRIKINKTFVLFVCVSTVGHSVSRSLQWVLAERHVYIPYNTLKFSDFGFCVKPHRPWSARICVIGVPNI
jgi:hypothetical protein